MRASRLNGAHGLTDLSVEPDVVKVEMRLAPTHGGGRGSHERHRGGEQIIGPSPKKVLASNADPRISPIRVSDRLFAPIDCILIILHDYHP